MRKIKKQIIRTLFLLVIGYGVLNLIGWIMSLSVPVPVLIVVFCWIIYYTLKNIIERRI